MRAAIVVTVLVAAVLSGLSSAATPARDRLTITVWPQGRGADKAVSTARLTCRPPGGTHPHPVKACRRLFANLGALVPIPPNRLCLGVYGGPQVAYVRGSLKGRQVRSWLNRKNACEIRRWNALGIVLRVG